MNKNIVIIIFTFLIGIWAGFILSLILLPRNNEEPKLVEKEELEDIVEAENKTCISAYTNTAFPGFSFEYNSCELKLEESIFTASHTPYELTRVVLTKASNKGTGLESMFITIEPVFALSNDYIPCGKSSGINLQENFIEMLGVDNGDTVGRVLESDGGWYYYPNLQDPSEVNHPSAAGDANYCAAPPYWTNVSTVPDTTGAEIRIGATGRLVDYADEIIFTVTTQLPSF